MLYRHYVSLATPSIQYLFGIQWLFSFVTLSAFVCFENKISIHLAKIEDNPNENKNTQKHKTHAQNTHTNTIETIKFNTKQKAIQTYLSIDMFIEWMAKSEYSGLSIYRGQMLYSRATGLLL